MRNFLRLSLILMVICAVSATTLAFTYSKTWPIIAERRRSETFNLVKQVLPNADNYEEIENDLHYFKATKNNELVGVAFSTEATGFGGPIRVLTVLGSDGKIQEVKVLGHLETPGYGSRVITEEWFLEQYVGKETTDSLAMGTDLDILSGATVSSNATNKAIRIATDNFNELFSIDTQDDTWLLLADKAEPVVREMYGNKSVERVFASEERVYFEVSHEGNTYKAIPTIAEGFIGPIELLVIFNNSEQIEEIVVLEHQETDGYGSKVVTEEWFLEQFQGLATEEATSDTVDMISGATVSSTAVQTAINEIDFSLYQDKAKEALLEMYPAQMIKRVYIGDNVYFEIEVDGSVKKAIPVEAEGFIGPIEMVVIFDDSEQIEEIVVLEHQETDGYGSKVVSEEWFLEQFQGLAAAEATSDSVDMISGATVSSTAVQDAINTIDMKQYQDKVKEALLEKYPSQSIERLYISGAVYYQVEVDGSIKKAIPVEAEGFIGPIEMVVVLTDNELIEEVMVLAHQETDGYGSKVVTEEWFLEQFQGLAVEEVTSDSVDMISGATVSSTAVQERIATINLDNYRSGGEAANE